MHKTVKFYTLGCKVNQYDTQVMREQLLSAGLVELDNGTAADVYVVNTCTVTGRADSDSLNLIRRAKKENPAARIIVTGCLAELDKQKILQQVKQSVVVRNKDKERIAQFLGISHEPKAKIKGISYFAGRTRAFLKIQDGCDNFCSYCKVPFVRGRSCSKPLKVIVYEAENIAARSFKEIVLCGICLGAWGRDLKPREDLVRVINELEKIPALLRIRLSSIEPGDITHKLLRKIATSKKLCRHLHIPLQSGDDEVLKGMNRRYTRRKYRTLIKKVRKAIPGIAITTDCLVGFPGETDVQFDNTVELIKEIKPLKVHIFPYSPRPGTIAAKGDLLIKAETIKKRIAALQQVADQCALNFQQQFLGKQVEVLVEGRSKLKPGYLEGHTDNYIKVVVNVNGAMVPENSIVKVKIKEIDKACCFGALLFQNVIARY